MNKFIKQIFISFIIFFFLQPRFLYSQIFHTYPYAGFSISLNSKWNIKSESNINSPLFAYLKLNKMYLGINLTKIPIGSNPIISQREALKIKPELITSLKQRGVTVNTFDITESSFKGQKCFKTNATIQDPEYYNGILQYYNTIQFIHHGFLFNIVCSIPVSNNSVKEIAFIKKELETIILY